MSHIKTNLRIKRHTALRTKIHGTPTRPRLSVYRGLRHLYVQLIDDTSGKTILGVSDKTAAPKGTGIERAQALAKAVAAAAKEKNITQVVFDRGGFHYHGQIKTLAETLREEGITI